MEDMNAVPVTEPENVTAAMEQEAVNIVMERDECRGVQYVL